LHFCLFIFLKFEFLTSDSKAFVPLHYTHFKNGYLNLIGSKEIVIENAFPTPPLEQGSVFCHNPEFM